MAETRKRPPGGTDGQGETLDKSNYNAALRDLQARLELKQPCLACATLEYITACVYGLCRACWRQVAVREGGVGR